MIPRRRPTTQALFRMAMVIAIGCSVCPHPVRAQQITSREVKLAVRAAETWLRTQQQADGRWPEHSRGPGGTTALAVLALIQAGVPVDDAALQRGLEAVKNLEDEQTYVVSLKIQALAAADPRGYRPQIETAAAWLVKAQRTGGMWGYRVQGRDADFSNTQFALLGLHEAARAGVTIEPTVWNRAQQAWIKAQNRDGGWSYHPQAGQSTGSMTSAGIASLHITGNALVMRRRTNTDDQGRPICCGQYAQFRPIARGLEWLADNWSVQRNPGAGAWLYYYLYGVERVGIISGLRFLGAHDWYREGAARLVALQRADGTWHEQHTVADTCLALLFLAKGRRPVLFHKLTWGDPTDWNMTRNDLAHLCAFIGDRLGEPVAWDTVGRDAPLEDWISAPILYFNGETMPEFNSAAMEKLVKFVFEGGTVLAVGTCRPDEFHKQFVPFVAAAFPDDPLTRLPPEHPVFSALFQVDGSQIELYGLGTGCRTSVFYCPFDIACQWEVAELEKGGRESFELGANIAAYATGLEPLPDRLAVARLVGRDADPADRPPARGAVHIAQLMHNGDWRPNPRAIRELATHLHDQLAVDVVPESRPLRATDGELMKHPIIYLTGHFSFELSDAEIEALRGHLERGGFLLANACCGRTAFDTSFRELAAKLFPDHALTPLPSDHPILAGRPGVKLDTLGYRASTDAAAFRQSTPSPLEGITLDGRTVVVYSPISLDCGLDGHACFACRGFDPASARSVAGNAILYALSY